MDKRIRRFVSFFLYAAMVIQDHGEELWKELRGRTGRRIAAWVCSLCLVLNLLPMTSFAAGTGTSGMYEYEHKEEGGYIEVKTPTEQPTETPTEQPTETPLEKNEIFTGTCTCDTLCIEGIINLDCKVCSAEGADLSAVCEGREFEITNCICDPVVTGNEIHTNPDCPLYVEPEITAYKQVVALFQVLPSADSITEDTTEEERDILRAQIDAAIDALYALSDENFAKFTAEHEALLAAVKALREALEETVPNFLADVTPTASNNNIYANGVDIRIVAGLTDGIPNDNTNILYDVNGDGQIGDTEYLQVGTEAPSASGYRTINNIYGVGGNITMEGGRVQIIYGGSDSQYEGDTNITMTGGKTEQVFGGGAGSNGSVKGNTNIAISGGTVNFYVYGGGHVASVDGTTTITITGGTVKHNVYGGSREASVNGAKTVTIGASAKIGNNNTGGIVIDGGTGNITNGVTSFIIGDDLTGADGSILVSLPAGYTGGTIATEAVSGDLAKLKLVGRGAEGRGAYLDGTAIKVGEEGTAPTVDESQKRIYANGAEIKIVAGTTTGYTNILYDKNGNKQIEDTEYLQIGTTVPGAEGYDLSQYKVYGGSIEADLTGNPKITMEGGKVHTICGGGYVGGSDKDGVVNGNTEVIISGGEAGFVYGGSDGQDERGKVIGNTKVTISNTGKVTSVVYGGSRGTNVDGSTEVIVGMGGSVVGNVYGGSFCKGGKGGVVTQNTAVIIKDGGTVDGSIYGGGTDASNTDGSIFTGAATVDIRGGTVKGAVYGGGRDTNNYVSSTVGSSSVIISGGAKIGSIDKPNSGIIINGGTDIISNGVTSFVIGDDLTGAAESIFVSLPAGYTGGIIATEAVSGDLAKIKLAGDGAVGKQAYLEGTAIKVGQPGEDKTALAEAIAAANSAKSGITVSDNPASSVANGTKFVTTAEMKALTEAIAAAQKVMDNSFATAGEITAAVNALNSAVTTFKAAIKTGTDTGSDGGTSDGGSSGGGSSSGGSSNRGTKTPPATTKPGELTESEIKMEGMADASGNVTVTLPEQHVQDAIKKAEEEARKSGNPVKGISLLLNVNTSGNPAGNVTVNLPKVTQETIIRKEIVNTMIVVNHPEIKISLDLSAVQEINRQANADVNITSARQDNNKLTGNAKAVIGTRPVFDLKVNYGSGKEVTHFGAGSVSVAIPYTLGVGEAAGGVYAVYVDGSGNVQWMNNSVYDAENRLLRFNTSHFSVYGIGYQAPTAFTDIQSHWAKNDIQFVVTRGMINGASATTFDPTGAVTRGMFVAALGRLAGADVSGYAASSFTDVRADAYYMGYVEWAVKNGIVSGTSATTFAPDNAVTREQMAAMMTNYARIAGITLPKVHTENTFADGANISAEVREAVKTMQMAGVLAGRNGNRFDPQGTAIRAQAAATLRRFIEVTIDVSTAQGWRQNDDGQWMYYENGSPVKHTTKQVGGENYSFNAFGVTLDYPKKKTGTGTYTV